MFEVLYRFCQLDDHLKPEMESKVERVSLVPSEK